MRTVAKIEVDTDAFLDANSGPGRFVVASNSAMVERFFESGAADFAAGVFDGYRDPQTGIIAMTKVQLNEIYGLARFGIIVDNKEIYDGLDDYAERVYIYGHIGFQISGDARFTIHPDGRLEIQNFSLEIRSGDNFDFVGGDSITTIGGEIVLEPAIDPSRIGQTVLLDFDTATSYTYTEANYTADVARVDGFSTLGFVAGGFAASRAMGGIIRELFDAGTINTVTDGRLVLYGSDDANEISHYTSRIGINVSDTGATTGFPNPLSEYAGAGLIYVAGGGDDTITGTLGDDVLFGNAGADQLFGGGADDFIFFDADDTVVNGGAGRDVGVALGTGGVTVDMLAQGLEVVIGGGGADVITASGGTDPLFAAGGDGDDTFVVTHNDTEGPKILWGGAGADTFEFNQSNPELLWEQAGIAVVEIANLTAEMFATLTLADLGLGGLDLSKIDAIILNPDAGDRFKMDGALITTSMINIQDHDMVNAGGHATPATFEARSSGFLGGTQAIQWVFANEVRVENHYSELYDFFQIDVTATGDVVVTDTDFFFETGGIANLEEAIAHAVQNSHQFFEENDHDWVAQQASDVPFYFAPFFVVGGRFTGAALTADGALAAQPVDPGNTPFDWLRAA